MATVYLIRHGQTEWNTVHRVMGRKHIPLNEEGQRQAEELAKIMKNMRVDTIFSSPQLRARQTADEIAKNRKVTLQLEEAIAEVDHRNWTGRYFEELKEDPDYHAFHTQSELKEHPAFETIWQVKQRVCGFFDRVIIERPQGHFAFVTHADLVRVLLNHLLVQPLSEYRRFRIANAALTALEQSDQRWILTLFNYRKDPENVILKFKEQKNGKER